MQFEKILLKHGWEKIPNWECFFVHREKGLFLSVYVDDMKLAGKKQIFDPMWKVLNQEVDLGEPTSFLDHANLGWRNYHSLKIFVFLHGLMTWLVMQGSVWKDIVSGQTRRLNNSTKYLLHASMITTLKKKK